MDVDDVDELMLDTQEAIEHQAEISRILAEKLTDEDEEEILRELELLDADNGADIPLNLPEVPKELPSRVRGAAPVEQKQRQRVADPS